MYFYKDSNLPTQTLPPGDFLYPGLQWHLYDPGVFSQTELWEHAWNIIEIITSIIIYENAKKWNLLNF